MDSQTPTPTPEALAEAAQNLKSAYERYAQASQKVALLKYSLEHKRAVLIARGLEGKNVEERSARLRLALADETTALVEAELAQATERTNLDTTRLHWDYLRTWLRLLEVTAPSPTRE
jgi:hypothetical protein